MKIKPLLDRVLIKVDAPEEKTKSGILIPTAAQEKLNYATVIEVGPGTEKSPMSVKVGDRIMFDKYSGVDVKVDGEDYILLGCSNILAIIE